MNSQINQAADGRRRARPRPRRQAVAAKALTGPMMVANPPVPKPEPRSDARPSPLPADAAGLRRVRFPPPAQLDHVGATGLKPVRPSPAVEASTADVHPLELDAQDIECIAELAYDYAMSGAYEVARVLYAGLVALEPRVAHHRLGLGLACDRRGDLEAAKKQFEIAARLDPASPTPLVNLAELCLASGDRRHAFSLLRTADRLSFDDARLRTKIRSMIALLTDGGRRE